ncbi:MAG: hypothetical protein U1E42_00400 [Rhodospirillales bacterium]
MTRNDYGWAWFESFRDHGIDPTTQRTGDLEVVKAFARCFGTADGQRVLRHLRALTLDRSLGPGASDTMLRHLEGQRSLVTYIVAATARGSHGPTAGGSGPATTAPTPETPTSDGALT